MNDDAVITAVLRHIQRIGLGRPIHREPRGAVLGLQAADLAELRRIGTLGHLSGRELLEDETLHDGPGIAFASEAFDALLDSRAPDSAVFDFLAASNLVRLNTVTDTLTLLSREPLTELLPRHAGDARAPALEQWPESGCEPAALHSRRDFCGTHAVCGATARGVTCGDRLCWAEHAWVVGGLCLAYVHTGSFVTGMYLYPFRTVG